MGAAYIGYETKDQRGGFNFLPQAGAGISFPGGEKTAITFEYRFRHLSNAGLRMPNAGIDAHMLLVGVKFVL